MCTANLMKLIRANCWEWIQAPAVIFEPFSYCRTVHKTPAPFLLGIGLFLPSYSGNKHMLFSREQPCVSCTCWVLHYKSLSESLGFPVSRRHCKVSVSAVGRESPRTARPDSYVYAHHSISNSVRPWYPPMRLSSSWPSNFWTTFPWISFPSLSL